MALVLAVVRVDWTQMEIQVTRRTTALILLRHLLVASMWHLVRRSTSF
jgi:hypothetical protein